MVVIIVGGIGIVLGVLAYEACGAFAADEPALAFAISCFAGDGEAGAVEPFVV